MQIKPRQHLLDIWQAVARHSFDNGKWNWGEQGGSSSVADAERLLCLMYPATEIPAFRLDEPDTTKRDVERALKRAGGRMEIPGNLVTVLTQFMSMHAAADESPTFGGGQYFGTLDPQRDVTQEQRELGVVDSFSMSVTLCLATLGFLKVYEEKTSRTDMKKSIARLREATSVRLTAAMVSLLRSFAVNVFDPDSPRASGWSGSSARAGRPNGPYSSSSSAASSRCAPRSRRASRWAWTSRRRSRTTTSSSNAAGPGAW